MAITDIIMFAAFSGGVVSYQVFGWLNSGEPWSWKYWRPQLATFIAGFMATGFKVQFMQGVEIAGENDWLKWFLAGVATAYAIAQGFRKVSKGE